MTTAVACNASATNRAAASNAPTTACALATLADLTCAFGLEDADPDLARITFPVRRLKAGDTLVRAGDRFDTVYVIRSGFFKTVRTDAAGSEMVLALPMGGEAIGLDAIDPGRYTADVIALDASLVAVVPFARLTQLAREHPSLERALFRAFSRELGREHSMIWLLGTLDAEARLAAFLLDLSERFGRLGYSRTVFELRMTRHEIGSYLGIKLETVSRTLSGLAAGGLIAVDRRTVTLKDLPGLRRILEPGDASAEREFGTVPAAARALPSRNERQTQFPPARGVALATA
jgi:CRP/FNR family transcriptional regulator